MSKKFMSLSNAECLEVYNDVLKNADSLYKDAIILANNESYGRATSLLIHFVEEKMKAFVLFLDGNGFQFRNKTPGIFNLFENHTLRYPLAMALSIITVFSIDIKNALTNIKSDPNTVLKETEDSIMEKFFIYIIERIPKITEEIDWFSKAEVYRQEGFYVDYKNGVKTPLNATMQEFNDVKNRVDNMNKFINAFFEGFSIKDKEHQEQLQEFRSMLSKPGKNGKNIYIYLGEQIERFRDRKQTPYDDIAATILGIQKTISNRNDNGI